MNEKDMWLCMFYNNRGAGIAPQYWDRFVKFCEQNGLTDEPPMGQRLDGKDKWFEHFKEIV